VPHRWAFPHDATRMQTYSQHPGRPQHQPFRLPRDPTLILSTVKFGKCDRTESVGSSDQSRPQVLASPPLSPFPQSLRLSARALGVPWVCAGCAFGVSWVCSRCAWVQPSAVECTLYSTMHCTMLLVQYRSRRPSALCFSALCSSFPFQLSLLCLQILLLLLLHNLLNDSQG